MKLKLRDLGGIRERVAEKVCSLGRQKVMRYGWLMGPEDKAFGALEDVDRKSARQAALALGAAVLILAVSVLGKSGGEEISEIERPAYGEAAVTVDARAELVTEEGDLTVPAVFEISPPAISEERAAELFEGCSLWLKERLSLDEQGRIVVRGDLDLPQSWENGVLLSWGSSAPAIISDEGGVRLMGSSDGDVVELECVMMAEGYTEERTFSAVLVPSEADLSAMIEAEVSAVRQELASDGDESSVALPSDLKGMDVVWKKAESGPGPEAALAMLMLVPVIWLGRYGALERKLKIRASAVEEQTADVMTALILYLDAGLVADAAVAELTADGAEEKGPLYKAMADIKRRCEASNVPFPQAFYSYAVSSGSRELIRFASLIKENSTYGSGLSQKLRAESARMHDSRLSRAKARAKEIETKLCMPLMLLLASLLAIAAGPVLLTM
ncbi:MAG: hypothetical protein IJK59_07775 [Firmicutes bacterium]|nr:hypothetical protein [Bacillota bacterium]